MTLASSTTSAEDFGEDDDIGSDEMPSGRLRLAVEAALARESRQQAPEGEWREGLWFPSLSERRPCCDSFIPTPGNKQALESHCRSAGHVAALYDVPVLELRRAIRRARLAKELLPSPVAGAAPKMTNTERLARISRAARSEAFEILRRGAQTGNAITRKLSNLDEGAPSADLNALFEEAGKCLESLVIELANAAQMHMVFKVAEDAAANLRALKKD